LKTVTLYIDAQRTMEIVRELRQQGMIQGIDFEFTYVSSTEFTITDSPRPRHAIFAFNTEKYATFFALKYSI
jgi:hypothetical protein